jgi:hypothetical protein
MITDKKYIKDMRKMLNAQFLIVQNRERFLKSLRDMVKIRHAKFKVLNGAYFKCRKDSLAEVK